MLQKSIIYTDRHKRDKDFETIGNYLKMTHLISMDLLNYVKTNNITYGISAGDLYDKGFSEVGPSYKDSLDDIKLSEALKGNSYITIGNHLFLDRDRNPELYLIQPNDKYKPKTPVEITEQVIKCVDYIIIGNVQFSFFHFTKDDAKMYIRKREPGVKYHVGIYHDDCVVPMSVRKACGIAATTNNDYLAAVYADIDFAIVGHIHTKIGMTNLILNGRKVPILIPGALTITKNQPSEIHTSVELPVFTIDDEDPDYPLTIDLVPFSLHTEVLQFHKKKVKSIPESQPNLEVEDDIHVLSDTKKVTSYLDAEDFLQMEGLDDRSVSLFRASSAGVISVTELMRITYNKVRY